MYPDVVLEISEQLSSSCLCLPLTPSWRLAGPRLEALLLLLRLNMLRLLLSLPPDDQPPSCRDTLEPRLQTQRVRESVLGSEELNKPVVIVSSGERSVERDVVLAAVHITVPPAGNQLMEVLASHQSLLYLSVLLST